MRRLILLLVAVLGLASSVFADQCDDIERLKYAAKLGLPEYEYKLAQCYLKSGDATLRKDGIDWLELAASYGLAEAEYDLSEYYRTGTLTEKDIDLACAYFVVSTDGLSEDTMRTEEFKRRLRFYRTTLSPIDQRMCDELADDFVEDAKAWQEKLAEKIRKFPAVYEPYIY